MGRSYVIPAAQSLPTTVIVKERKPEASEKDKNEDDSNKDEVEMWKRKYYSLEAQLAKYQVENEIVIYDNKCRKMISIQEFWYRRKMPRNSKCRYHNFKENLNSSVRK